ncbi:hypothetical protein V2G26_014444 [Clonostachys chloroleuca]
MPSIDLAMARSLEPSAWEKVSHSLARSVVSQMESRNIIDSVSNKVTDIRTALSSWDNCMNANFCKYPVIAIIAVGGLIVLSILYCCARCLCLGKACCCSCCNCMKCCGNCCGCCDPPDSRKNKYLDEQFAPQDQGYRTQPPMQPFAPVVGTTAPPQYAEFDVSKHNDDSLPQMPSWENSQSSKVANKEQESLEMSNLNATSMAGGASSVSGRSGQDTDNYGPNYSKPQNPYDSRDAYDMDHSYDMPPAAIGGVGGRNSPGPAAYRNQNSNSPYHEMPTESYGPPSSYGPLDNSYGQQNSYRGVPSPAPMRQNTYNSVRTASPGPNYGGYGSHAQTSSPAPYGGSPHMRNSPGPQQSGVMPAGNFDNHQAYSPTRDNFGQESYGQDNYGQIHAPTPRQYTQSPRPIPTQEPFHQRQPSSPIVNNSGFDFNSGYTRPPSVDQQGAGGYPGYKPYRA